MIERLRSCVLVVVSAAAFVILSCAADSSARSPEEQSEHTTGPCAAPSSVLRQLVIEIHEKQRNVGVAVSVRKGGELVFSETIGEADLEHAVPVTAKTRFGIASLTKLFTAVTLLKLREEGLIDLDASVHDLLEEFPRKEEGDITIRMLATHRSGLPHPQERTPDLFATHYETAIDAVEVFADEPLVSIPGEKRVYSSSNYNLLAAVMEGVTGQPFEELVRDRVFIPLGLEATHFDDIRYPTEHRSERYSYYHPWTYAESDELYEVPRWDYSFNPGGGNLVSTADDVARFGAALTSPGLLGEESLEILYDEAWFGKRMDDSTPFLYTTGANPGVQAGIAILPDSGIAAAVASNTWGIGSRSGEMAGLANRLARECRGDPNPDSP